jgi:hypothetical protein
MAPKLLQIRSRRDCGLSSTAPSIGSDAKCGKEIKKGPDAGYTVIFDGSKKCFERWEYTGGASATLQKDGTILTGPGDPGLGVLWYAERPYGDFSLRLEFRDDAPEEGARANSGVQVRFPAPIGPVPGCPTTFNGNEQNNDAWIAVNCGHEIQINDATEGDPRKTGSIYGFADLGIEEANPVEKGTWSELEIRVVGQTYTIYRDGVQINEFENVDGLPFPGRPNDPGSDSRDLVGYLGLQAHGSPNDYVSFRNVRVLDLSAP